MIQSVWHDIPKYYQGFHVDTFQVMPNHLDGILTIVASEPITLSLSDVIHRFKTLTTRKYIDGVRKNNWQPSYCREASKVGQVTRIHARTPSEHTSFVR